MARQSLDEGFVAIGCRRHIAHVVGDLVDLPPDGTGGLEYYDVELDVEALDGGAHARGARSDHDHIVERLETHDPTLRLWTGPVGYPWTWSRVGEAPAFARSVDCARATTSSRLRRHPALLPIPRCREAGSRSSIHSNVEAPPGAPGAGEGYVLPRPVSHAGGKILE